MGASPKQRAAASDASISLGLLTLVVDLVPVMASGAAKATSFSLLCNDCPAPTKPNQVYVCPVDATHGPWPVGQITRRGKEIDGQLVEVTEAEQTAVKTGTDSKDDGPPALTLGVCPAAEVEQATLPGDIAYRLRPKDKTTHKEFYVLLRQVAADPTKAFIGSMTIRNTTRLFRLTVWQGQMVAQSLIWPDDLAPADTIEGTVDEKYTAMADDLVAQLLTPFDPDAYRNEAKVRALALMEAKAADPGADVTTLIPSPAKSADDLGDLLEKMLSTPAA